MRSEFTAFEKLDKLHVAYFELEAFTQYMSRKEKNQGDLKLLLTLMENCIFTIEEYFRGTELQDWQTSLKETMDLTKRTMNNLEEITDEEIEKVFSEVRL